MLLKTGLRMHFATWKISVTTADNSLLSVCRVGNNQREECRFTVNERMLAQGMVQIFMRSFDASLLWIVHRIYLVAF